MKRRSLLKGLVLAVPALAVPTMATVGASAPELLLDKRWSDDQASEMARALARSMVTTKEQVAARVLKGVRWQSIIL